MNYAPQLAQLMVGVVAGAAAGWLHFRSLKVVTQRLLRGDVAAIGLQLVRFVALGLVLFLAARGGVAMLLGATVGVMLGRRAVLRRLEVK